MKSLVLGGGGFLGSHVVEQLLKAGHDVRVFEKEYVGKDNVEHLLSDIEWVEGDFTNPAHLKPIVKGVDYIVHSIGTTQPKTSNENPVYDIASNLIPTLYLLEAAKAEGVRKVVFFSSGGTVYGVPKSIPITEEHPTEPICSYGIQKLAIEKYFNLYHRLYQIDYGILRFSNPYGERQRPHASQGAITVFLHKALKNEPIEIWGDGSVTRDYFYVSDLADAVVSLLRVKSEHKIFNIGSGKGLSLLELVKNIEEVIGRKANVHFTSARTFDVAVNVLDISRAKEELLWSPQIGLQEGLERTMAYLSKLT
jgi:UDP-glucose 4-epimerase